jgi:hypothetical protein
MNLAKAMLLAEGVSKFRTCSEGDPDFMGDVGEALVILMNEVTRRSITSRYKWDTIPEEYNYAATDESGNMYAYISYPIICHYGFFVNNGSKHFYIGQADNSSDWAFSIERRP